MKVERIEASIKEGLSSSDVNRRINEKQINQVKIKQDQTYLNIIIKNTFTFYNLLLFLVTVCFIIAEVEITKYSFLLYALANTLIAVIQESKAKHTVDKLKLVTSPKAKVIRNGEEEEILAEEIVLDDIVKISISDQIPADCILISGNLEVNESMLTGESRSIKKKPGDVLLSGSYAVAGECYARADKIGENSYINTLQIKTKNVKQKKSKLMFSITTIIKTVGFLIIPIALLNYFKTISWGKLGIFLKSNEEFIKAIRSSGSLVVGMIPSGLILLTSTALAVGIVRLVKKNTLVRDLYSIESLARVNVICLDKTGTLTDGTMSVEKVIRYDIKQGALKTIMGSYLNSSVGTNQTNSALVEKFSLNTYYNVKDVLPFSSARKYSAVDFVEIGVYALGAPEFLLKREKYTEIFEEVQNQSQYGYRVLVLCRGNRRTKIDQEASCVTGKLDPVALFVIKDNIRKEAKPTIDWFNENGVEVKIISGDNALTVSKIAEQAGVLGADKCISLENMSDDEVILAATRFNVFGRVTPDQKALIIKTLQKNNKKVGFMGDGINDIVALKTADCSITVSSGSEAVKSISQVVLLDNDFSNLPSVVYEGRRVINNIQLTSALFLMKTFFIMITALFSLVTLPSYEFRLEQFIIIQTFCIGIPGVILSLQPSKNPIKGNFLKNVALTAIPAALLLVVPVLMVYLFNALGIVSDETKIPLSVLLSTISAYSVLYRLCKPFNKTKRVLFITMVIAGLLYLFIAPDSMLIPDYLQGKTLTEIIRYYIESFLVFLRFDFLNTSILKYFGTVEYIFLGSTLILCWPFYILLSKMVSHTVNTIETINPNILNDEDDEERKKESKFKKLIKKIFKKREL